MYQVATAVLSPADITVPLRNLFKNDKNVKTILSEVKEINKEKKEITLDNAEVISYDKLIISAGSSYSFFGKNEWSKFAKGLKVINDNGAKSLSPFAKFIKDISINVPVLYGMFSILLALILGVGAAILRRFFSNLRKNKQSVKTK